MVKFIVAFDTQTRTWYVEDPPGVEAEAKSLRELKKLLPRGSTIPGYSPQGYVAPVVIDRQVGFQTAVPRVISQKIYNYRKEEK